METIRFGTTSDPCKTRSIPAAEGSQSAEEIDCKGDGDPDAILPCPFDKNHQIRACRFPYHLLKCRKNHPKLARELKTCPFNARHLVPKHELTHHTETCEDRISVDGKHGGSTDGLNSEWQVPASTWLNPNMTDDWDKEADDSAAPFVWGINTIFNQKPEARSTNDLGPSFRAPNTLPWKDGASCVASDTEGCDKVVVFDDLETGCTPCMMLLVDGYTSTAQKADPQKNFKHWKISCFFKWKNPAYSTLSYFIACE